MISIFHGDDIIKSRQAFLSSLPNRTTSEVLHLSRQQLDANKVNNFLFGPTLFALPKSLAIDGFFGLSAPQIKTFSTLISASADDTNILLWQDKKLSAAQLKVFPTAKVSHFPASNLIFSAIRLLQYRQKDKFFPLHQQILDSEPFELYYFFLKRHFRTNDPRLYSQMIENEYLHKSGLLSTPLPTVLTQLLLDYLLPSVSIK